MNNLPNLVRTPKTLSFTLAAGAILPWPVQGHVVRLLSLTGVSSLQVAFDDSGEETFYAGISYPCRAGLQFERLTFRNAGSALVAVIAVVSDEPIDAPANVGGASNVIDETTVANGAATLLFAANPTRAQLVIAGVSTNTNVVLLGDSALAADHYMWRVTNSGFWNPVPAPKHAIYGWGLAASQKVFGYELS
ncbi:MAG: hypothetical protein JW993_10245 [Sedimentisphaerales bacterium]|nr:hypothetical protein [Sedimentisphaerales bacterium]